jgi:hypothetical protein
MEKAQLDDIIQYTPETYFSDEELELIRAHFNGPQGAKLLKVVRKALLPTISDPDLPVEEMAKDMFMSAVDFRQVQDSEAKPIAMGLQLSAKIIAGALMQLRSLANIAPDDEKNREARRAKDSAK